MGEWTDYNWKKMAAGTRFTYNVYGHPCKAIFIKHVPGGDKNAYFDIKAARLLILSGGAPYVDYIYPREEAGNYAPKLVKGKRVKAAVFRRSDTYDFVLFQNAKSKVWQLIAGCHTFKNKSLAALRKEVIEYWADDHAQEFCINRGSTARRTKLNRETRKKLSPLFNSVKK